MYFTPLQIVTSIAALAGVHSFHGITFLSCKKAGLPIGDEVVFPLDNYTDEFLREHHRLDPGSDWFFQPFKSADREKKWVRPDYSAKDFHAAIQYYVGRERRFGKVFKKNEESFI